MKKNISILTLLMLMCSNILFAQQSCSNKMVVASGGIANNRCMLTVGESIVSNQFTSLQVGYQSMPSFSCRNEETSAEEVSSPIRSSMAYNESILFPNPASNQITIGNINNASYYHYFLFDYTGKLILENNLTASTSQAVVDITKLGAALYILRLVDLSTGNSQTFKFFKNN